MKNFVLLYSVKNGYQSVRADGMVVCGKHFGQIIPEWDNSQEMKAYYQVEATGTLDYVICAHKQKIFQTAENRNRRKRA